MKVVIIGSGNVATVLGKRVLKSSHQVIQVVGRNLKAVSALSSILNTDGVCSILEINRNADVYIICVPDSSIAGIAAQLRIEDRIVVHTAGSVSKGVLSDCSKRFGVLYPVQSIRKEIVEDIDLPAVIDGSSSEVEGTLRTFASSWATSVTVMDDAERLKLHVAAVLSSNFANHLYALTSDFCTAEKVDFKLLIPLLTETASRLTYLQPADAQTGPAVRGDLNTIRRHQDILESYPEIKKVYDVLTESIIQYYKMGK